MESEYVEVTEEMRAAGAEALSEHHHGDDLKEVAEDVFYAMFYTRKAAASEKIASM